MRIYLMTDMEGVAGVNNFDEWTSPGKFYYPVARELLTQEVNAVVDGFFAGGATRVVVIDAHGPGGVNITGLDTRAEYQRGWADPVWPLTLDPDCYDAVAYVGQHAKACTPYGHLCHTQSTDYIDEQVNGVSIGEFGELALCAAELGLRGIFCAGDEAFTKEAQALIPGVETVAGKRGLKGGTGADLDAPSYVRYVSAALHQHPVRVRAMLREGAERAVRKALKDPKYGFIKPLSAPFERVVTFRPGERRTTRTVMRVSHPTSFIGAMNAWSEEKPLEE